MASVTQRIKIIQQPRGGYLPLKSFSKEIYDDGIALNEEENIHSSIVGIAVDYLTRYMSGDSVDQAFHISTLGAEIIGKQNIALFLKSNISGLDNKSIIAACKLAGFDVCYRSSVLGYKPIEEINPDTPTIENIRIMVKRSLAFWEMYGPVIYSEPTFEGGYSSIVNSGDGDYITADTLWDFKVSSKAPTSKHTLQILMYYVMGLHSIHECYKSLTHLGFFNPRLNIVYRCPITVITEETIAEIENTVICYNVPVKELSKPQKSISATTTTAVPSEVYYSVADICRVTGQKANDVYADIRSGKLTSSKKGNKYIIFEDEYNRYIEEYKRYIENVQRQKAVIASVVIGIIVLFLFFIMIGL
jgi:hypothetical protein